VATRSEGITTAHKQANDLSQQANAAHARGDLKQATELYQQALSLRPADQASLSDAINLGALLRQQGQLQQAAQHYRQWLPQLPQTPTFSLNACNCLRQLGAAAEALAVVERCLVAHPNEAGLVVGQAECLLDLGQLGQSRRLLEGLLRQHTKLRPAWVTLGVVLARQQQLVQALEAFEMADRLEPDQGPMAANRINLLKDLGRLDQAEQLWNSLDHNRRQHVAVRGALAGLRLAQNQAAQASVLLAKLCEEQPQEPTHWLNWAACLRGLKFTVAPTAVLQRALLHHPQHWELQEALAQALAEMGSSAATQRVWQRQAPRSLAELKDVHVFNRQFLGIGSELLAADQLAQQAQEGEQVATRRGVGRLWPDHLLEPLAQRPLRVGYLTSDACNHPVGRFLLPILKHHDSSAVETWVLSCGSHDDWITRQLRQASHHWLDLVALTDVQAARLVADLRLDVVVELGGFTGGSRIGILVHRPAPVQLSYLGYPAPTYLRCIDGWIGDAVLFGDLNPTDQAAHRPLLIEDGYMAFDAGGELELPPRDGGPRFRFGCFNHARKLTDTAIDLFVAVLRAVPEAELVLKSISFHEEAERLRIQRRFVAAGLESERLTLLNWVEGGLNHLMRYSGIDVALDPIPYGGATTTCEALWMGVPVVSLAGSGMAGRLSASLLASAGCSHWIADTANDYVAIARSLAAAGLREQQHRLALRQQVAASPMADARRLSRALEGCYRDERSRIVGL